MKVFAVCLIVGVVVATPALGAPGDLKLIQGKLEWPATLSGNEAFIVVRGDDGHAYYADVVAARRYVQGGLSAGSPASLLGLEGAKPHEIIAVALGTGDATALSVAIAQAGPTPSRSTATSEAPLGSAQRPSGSRGDGYWHYCQSANAYYPTVQSCPGPWILVAPRSRTN